MPSVWGLYLWDVTSTEMSQRHCSDLGASIHVATLGFTLLIAGTFPQKDVACSGISGFLESPLQPSFTPTAPFLVLSENLRSTAHDLHAFLCHLSEKSMVSLVCLFIKLMP